MANFFSQEENAFDTWFQQMKDQLSEDAAGNLQLQIDNLTQMLMESISALITEDGDYIVKEDNEYLACGM